jgi:hypothetical protein
MVAFQPPAPSPPPKKEGERLPSRFDGLRAKEVDEATAARAAVAAMMPQAMASVTEPPKPADKGILKSAHVRQKERPVVPEWAMMTKADIVAFGAEHGVSLDTRLAKREMVQTLMAEVFDAD